MNTEESRKQFELSGLTASLYRNNEPGRYDEYEDPFVQFAWRARQAAQTKQQWISVSERLPEYLKPVWIKSKGKVSQFQWVYDAGDDDCWFEPWTPHFTDGSTLDIDSVEMWAYCDLPPAAPVKDGE